MNEINGFIYDLLVQPIQINQLITDSMGWLTINLGQMAQKD